MRPVMISRRGGFLPGDNELPGLVAGLDILLYETGWLQEGRFDAVLVAKSPFEDS